MLLHVPSLLTPGELAAMRARLASATWGDGRVTAGHQSVRVKDNLQLPQDSADAREMGVTVLGALG